MRLEQDVDAVPGGDGACGAQRGVDLSGMVGVVVEHTDAPRFAAGLEPACGPRERAQCGCGFAGIHAQPQAHRERGCGIEDVVRARHLQPEFNLPDGPAYGEPQCAG